MVDIITDLYDLRKRKKEVIDMLIYQIEALSEIASKKDEFAKLRISINVISRYY